MKNKWFLYIILFLLNPGLISANDIFPVFIESDNSSETAKIISISPNPVEDIVYIQYNIPEDESAEVAIYNFMGLKLRSSRITHVESQIKFDISDLDPGVYIVSVVYKGRSSDTKKIYKK